MRVLAILAAGWILAAIFGYIIVISAMDAIKLGLLL